MRAVSIDNLPPESILGKTIYAADGRPLLKRGATLTAKTVGTLARLGYQYIYISDDLTADIDVPDLITEETRARACGVVREAFQACMDGGPGKSRFGINADAIADMAGNLVEEILANPELSIQMVDLKSYDEYTFQHSVNTSVLGVVLGKSLKLTYPELKDLAIGLLLHDLGNVTVPETILKKPTKLTDEEYKYIYEHPRSGFELLRQCDRISAPAKIVALQHHERVNGTGYPKGLRGPDIHINAQIAAIVDTYDALTSDRTHRKRHLPQEAMEYLMGATDVFSFDLVSRFVAHVAPYPPGTIVQLNTGDVGIVLAVDMAVSTRPRIRLMRSPEGHPYPPDEVIDLLQNPTLVITAVLEG